MTEFTFTMDYMYQDIDTWKEKDAVIISNTIGCSRMGQHYVRDGYGVISFADTDKKREFANIVVSPEFDKKRTNCIVFNIDKSINDNRYDKIFIYHHNVKMNTYYGYILFNSETGKGVQIADTEGDLNDLLLLLNRSYTSFMSWPAYKKQMAYDEHLDSIFPKKKRR